MPSLASDKRILTTDGGVPAPRWLAGSSTDRHKVRCAGGVDRAALLLRRVRSLAVPTHAWSSLPVALGPRPALGEQQAGRRAVTRLG
jgi:hypothetical protein